MDSKYSAIESATTTLQNGNGFSAKRPHQDQGTVNSDKFGKFSKRVDLIGKFASNYHAPVPANGNASCSERLTVSIQEQRQNLPVYGCRSRILLEVRKSDTILIMGETGSGKTTQIPQFLHNAGYSQKGIIAITQPRRVAAITVAKRVSQEMNCRLGETVGFTVRFEDCTSKATKIRFMTDGSLLREALSDRLLKNYSVVVLDEVHERTINTDILFGIVKEAQKQRSLRELNPLKIVVTSATMDIDHFGKYFGVTGMYLEGRTFPVRVFHSKVSQSDYLHACLVTLFEIHREAPANHDVLIFLTGQEEIEAMAGQARQIAKTNDLSAPCLRVFPLYSQLPQSKQLDCFLPCNANTRKVILATNIAETSVTLPGIRYVIDCGYVKRRLFDPQSGTESLKIVRISQAQSWQRCGRAGRDSSGFCYRTYTKEEMESFEKMPLPEILRSNMASTALQLLALGIDCQSFDFLDKPSPETVAVAYKQLQLLGAIADTKIPQLTSLGQKMAHFPLDPKLCKLILSSSEFGCLEEILSLVAVMSGENIFVHPVEKREQATLAHAKFESKFGDHLTLLNVFRSFEKTEKVKLWCQDNFLNSRNLQYAKDVRQQLQDICNKLNIESKSCGASLDQVRKCLISGFFDNIAELQRDNYYLTISSRQRARIHPSSTLSGRMRAPYIIFSEIVSTERNFLRIVSSINPEWIPEVLPNYPHLNRIQVER